MKHLQWVCLFAFLIIAMLWSMSEMGAALDDEDIPLFSLWTGIATAIATVPMML